MNSKASVVGLLLLGVSSVCGLQVGPTSNNNGNSRMIQQKPLMQQVAAIAASAVVSAAVIAAPTDAWASDTAAQVSLQKLPPTNIEVNIKDLPVVGKLLSGSYSKIPSNIEVAKPSIVVSSPPNKNKAVQDILKNGHLEFDVSGIVSTHLDVDIAADQAGVMNVRVASGLIPKLPFKNLASATQTSPTGGKESAWSMVTNMGSGETYYYNEKLGVSQYERPDKF